MIAGFCRVSPYRNRFFRALDALLPYEDSLCLHLQKHQKHYDELFGNTFDFLFYDIISTNFEGTTTVRQNYRMLHYKERAFPVRENAWRHGI